jgi:hypothetical protein
MDMLDNVEGRVDDGEDATSICGRKVNCRCGETESATTELETTKDRNLTALWAELLDFAKSRRPLRLCNFLDL